VLLIRSLFWTVVLPGVVAVYVPWTVFGLNRVSIRSGDPLALLGLICIAGGAALLGACIYEFAARGRGTLSPADPPRHLVVSGLYRYVRNPMYVAVSTILLGEAAIARSLPLVSYWAFFFVVTNLFVMGYEEPYLRSRFGAEYDVYTRSVGRWIPGAPYALANGDRNLDEAMTDLRAGSFTKLDPLFDAARGPDGKQAWIVEWCETGKLDGHPAELSEALTCAAFNGRLDVLSWLLVHGVNPSGGAGTGLDALHWAANRGQLGAVKLLLAHHAPLETVNMHDTTALGTAVWSAINEPRAQHLAIVEVLLNAGANPDAVTLPTGDARLDAVIQRSKSSRVG